MAILFWILLLMTLGACRGRSPMKPKDCITFSLERTIDLAFKPLYVKVDRLDLYVTSTSNVEYGPNQTVRFFGRDLVARIRGIVKVVDTTTKKPQHQRPLVVQQLTDEPGHTRLVYPNEVVKAPKGMFPFDALIIPQGYFSDPRPGRLTVLNLQSPNFTEHVIHQSTQFGSEFTSFNDTNNSPRFYHRVLFLDMNGDGALDIVTLRSGFKIAPSLFPPYGELMWLENPGLDNIKPDVPWIDHLIYGGPLVGFQGPDIFLRSFDFDGDGIPEIVATHFFTGSKIVLYGVPLGATSWAEVDGLDATKQPRVADLVTDQGTPYDIQIVDLNQDGQMDILATNFQRFGSEIPGRVFALEQPTSGNIFTDPWRVHILLDNIRPQPPIVNSNPRFAPGQPAVFYPFQGGQPWIAVNGHAAGKAWILKPTATKNWIYKVQVLFDINKFYGPNTTQTILTDSHPPGSAIDIVDGLDVGYGGSKAEAQIFVPVYEARQIHVFKVNRIPKCRN